jgi:DNA-binding transcriptional MerR regulator
MDKSPEAFRTISEVAEEMDLPQHVLRFWETRFPQIKPLKRGGGRRYYRPDDVDLLRAVKQLLYGEGYTIKGVQKLLREQGAALVARGLAGRERAEATKAAASPVVEKSPAPRPAADAGPAVAQRGDVAALRAILGDLREAERLLSLARSGGTGA